MDLSKLSDAELEALYAQAKGGKKAEPLINAMDGMPWYQQFNEGMGKAFVDMGRGAGNIITDIAPSTAKLGFSTRADTDASRKVDAPLMDSGWGMTGNIAGNILPAVLMPGSTIPKALAYGAGLGAFQPVGKNDSRMENAAIGAVTNAALPIAGAAYKTGRALIEPVFAPGKTAARVVEQFADDPAALRTAARTTAELVPGSAPTLAQAALQPGISTLERGALNQPGPMQSAIAQRMSEQNAARLAALGGIAKDEPAMTAAIAAREAAAGPGYEAAKAVMVTPDDALKAILTRPSMKPAFERAQRLAAENGESIVQGDQMSGSGLHYLKMALDDMIDGGAVTGIGKNEQRALAGTKEKLVGWMDSNIPEYAKARSAYASASQPINEMQFGQALIDKATPALSRVTGTDGKLQANAYGRALADAEGTAKRAIGKDLPLDRIVSPGAKDTLDNVAMDLERAQRAQGLGKAVGSPTAQFLTTQNLMRQIMGPLGMPQGMADKAASSLMATPVLGSALGWATKGAENRVQQEVANLLLNPAQLESALARIHKLPGPAQKRLQDVSPYLPAIATSGLFGAYGRE